MPRIEDDIGDPSRPPASSASANGGSNTVSQDQLLEDARSWLSPPDPVTNHNVECQARHEGTAEWFIQADIFKQWKTTGPLLWIHGKRMFVYLPLLLDY